MKNECPRRSGRSRHQRWALTLPLLSHRRARDDKIDSAEAFKLSTAVHSALTPREARDVVKMLCDDDDGLPREDILAAVAASRASGQQGSTTAYKTGPTGRNLAHNEAVEFGKAKM